MIAGQIDGNGIQSLRRRNMNLILSELRFYWREIARKTNKKTRILRKMELTQIEETQSDATISITYYALKGSYDKF